MCVASGWPIPDHLVQIKLAWQFVTRNYLSTANAVGLTLPPEEVGRIAAVFFGNLALAAVHPDFALHVLSDTSSAPDDEDVLHPNASLSPALASITPSSVPPPSCPMHTTSTPATSSTTSEYLHKAITMVDMITTPSGETDEDGGEGSSSSSSSSAGRLGILADSVVARGIFLVSASVARLVAGPGMKMGVLDLMSRAFKKSNLTLNPLRPRVPDGPKPRWIVGNIPDLLPAKGAVHAAALLTYRYGKITRLLLGKKEKVYIVADPNAVAKITASAAKGLPKQEVMPRCLFMADDKEDDPEEPELWSKSRRTLLPAFGTASMKHFVPAFHEASLCAIARFRAMAVDSPGTPFNCFEVFKELTFQVICRCGFGYNASRANPAAEDFTTAFEHVIHHQVARSFQFSFLKVLPTSSNRRFSRSKAAIERIVGEIVTERMASRPASMARGQGSGDHCDFLGYMLDKADPVTGEFIPESLMREQILVLLAAGHVTTTLLTSWSLFCIASHPEVEAKILAELREVLGSDPAALPSFAQVGKMDYLLMVLKETLRLYPAAQSVIRYHPEEVSVGGFALEAKCHTMTVPWVIHRDPSLWDDPEEFRPERFTPEAEAMRHPYAWMPFGSGPRVCIGSRFALLEVRAVLAVLLRNFHFEVPPGYSLPESRNPVEPDEGVWLVPSLRDPERSDVLEEELFNSLASFASHDPDAIPDSIPVHLDVVADVCAKSDEMVAQAKAAAAAAQHTQEQRQQEQEEPASAGSSSGTRGVTGGSGPAPGTLEVVVGYGSNMGTSRGFAESIGSTVSARYGDGLGGVHVVPLDSLAPGGESAHLLSGPCGADDPMTRAFVVVTSSYNGGPPDNARAFVEWLEGAIESDEGSVDRVLDGWFTAVFGCGNKQWGFRFQAVPKVVATGLEVLGGTPVCERGAGDDDTSLDMDFRAWNSLLLPGLDMAFEAEVDGLRAGDEGGVSGEEEGGEVVPEVQVVYSNGEGRQGVLRCADVYADGVECEVVENRELLGVEYGDRTGFSTRHVEVDVGGAGLEYRTGDHFGVFAPNPEAVVVGFAVLTGLYDELDREFVVEEGSVSWGPLVPGVASTLRFMLTYVVDLCGPPPRHVLRVLSEHASNAEEARELRTLGSSAVEDMGVYDEQVLGARVGINDILRKFPSVKFGRMGAWLGGLLPRLKPRLYSISSAPSSSGHCSLTVGVVREGGARDGEVFLGLASNYLAKRREGATVWGFVRTCDEAFRLPPPSAGGSTGGVPVVMIGPGTGIAPFRGFLLELLSREGPHAGGNRVFFGCREAGGDDLYPELLEEVESSGVARVSVAHSRQEKGPDGSRMYVQHKVASVGEELWDQVLSESAGGIVYVCGDGRSMARDVRLAFGRIAERVGGVEDGEGWVEGLQREGRYVEDVWG